MMHRSSRCRLLRGLSRQGNRCGTRCCLEQGLKIEEVGGRPPMIERCIGKGRRQSGIMSRKQEELQKEGKS